MAGTLYPFCDKSAPDMHHHVWEACPDAFLRLVNVQSTVRAGVEELSPATLATPGVASVTARDAALPEPGRALAQMYYSGLWRVSFPHSSKAYVPEATHAAVTVQALSHLTERPSLAKTLRMAAGAPPPSLAHPCREDV